MHEKEFLTDNGKERRSHQECIDDAQNGSYCNLEVGFGYKTYDHINDRRYNSYYYRKSAFNSKHELESS